MDKPSIGFMVGKYLIWPDSDSGSRPNDLRIECTQGRNAGWLVVRSYADGFDGTWNPSGWSMPRAVFTGLTPQEADMFRRVGINLLPGRLAEATARNLEERVNKVGAEELEKLFEKVFELCRKEVRRMQRPRVLRWIMGS